MVHEDNLLHRYQDLGGTKATDEDTYYFRSLLLRW